MMGNHPIMRSPRGNRRNWLAAMQFTITIPKLWSAWNRRARYKPYWTGMGSRRIVAESFGTNSDSRITTEIAITFPEWRGSNTVLEARRECRVLRQPLLLEITKAGETAPPFDIRGANR